MDNRLEHIRSVTDSTEERYGLKPGLLYKMVEKESAFGTQMRSPAGAQGWFQFMPPTAKEYNLDDPDDLEKSADAAGRYLRDLLKRRGGDYRRALADYNYGMGNVDKLLAKHEDSWEAHLPAETKDYLLHFEEASQVTEETINVPSDWTSTKNLPQPFGGGLSSADTVGKQELADIKHGGFLNSVADIPEDLALAGRQFSTIYNIWADKHLEYGDEDLSYLDDEEKVRTLTEGMPQEQMDYVLQSRNYNDALRRRHRWEELSREQAELGLRGADGIIASLLVGATDLPNVVAMMGTYGVGSLARTTILKNSGGSLLRTRASLVTAESALGAASNAGAEAFTSSYRPTATAEDVENAAYIGAALGGFGGFFGRVENPALLVENGALRQKAMTLWKDPNGFTMEPGTDLVRVVNGEVIPPAPKIGYDAPQLEGRILEGEFADVTGQRGIPGRIGLPEPTREVNVRPDNGSAIAIDRSPAPKGKVDDIEVHPRNEDGRIKDAPRSPEYTEKLDSKWNTPRYNKEGYLELPETNSVRTLANYIQRHSKNDALKAILRRVVNGLDEGLTVKVRVLEKGRFDIPAAHQQFINNIGKWRGLSLSRLDKGDTVLYLRGRSWGPKDGLNEEVFTHELIHANALSKYRNARNGKGGDELVQAAKDLSDLRKQVRAAFPDNNRISPRLARALDDEDEFLAYGLTNREVQDYLKATPYRDPSQTLWERFVDSLRRLLGIGSKDRSSFDELLDISSKILKRAENAQKSNLDDNIVAKYRLADDMEPDEGVREHGFPTIFGVGISREYRLLNKNVPDRVKELAAKIGGNKVGYKDHSVIENSVGEHADTLYRRWTVSLSKALWFKSGYDDWFKEMKAAGKYKQIERDYRAKTEFQEQVQDYVRGFDNGEDWHPAVVKAGDGVRKILGGDVLDNINNPSKIFNTSKRGMTQQEIRNPETGEVELTPFLERNKNYLPRRLNYQKISEMVRRIGPEGVQNFFAQARKANHPEMDDAVAQKFGKWYYETFNEAHAVGNEHHLSDLVSGLDQNALKMSLVKNGGMTEQEALDIIADMFPARPKKGGVANSNLKHRADIDETFTVKMEDKEGEMLEVSLNSFIDTNLEQNLHRYFKRMSGDIAFAHKLDIYTDSAWENLLNKTVRRDLKDPKMLPEEKLARWRRDLNWYREMTKGIPQEASTWWSRSLEMAMKFNVTRLMGMGGLNQAIEWGNLTGALGHKALLRSSDALDGLYRDVRTGKAPNDLVDQIEDLTGGAGSDFVKHAHIGQEDNWVRHSGDSKWNRRLDNTSSMLSRGAHRVYKYNGMLGQMVQQQRMYTIGAVNHWFKLATGKLDQSAWLTTKRLAWMGIDDAMYERITGNLRKYTKTKKGVSGQEADTVDFAKWQKEDAESMWSFLWGMERESRRIVQENDMASAAPIFDKAIGRSFFQFQGFGFHAWDKALMHGLSQKDLVVFNSVMHSGFISSLQYIGRTYMASVGMPEDRRKKFLERRMTAKQIVANSYGRTAFASLLPQLIDTVSPVPVFSGMRSTTDISSIFSSPVFQLLNTGIATKKYVRNALSDNYQTTGRDARATFNLLMLNNVPPMSILGNALAGSLPTNEQVNQ